MVGTQAWHCALPGGSPRMLRLRYVVITRGMDIGTRMNLIPSFG